MDSPSEMWYYLAIAKDNPPPPGRRERSNAVSNRFTRWDNMNFLEGKNMKRTKKLLALVLALAMSFATLVTPAMAAKRDDGNIAVPCSVCGHCMQATLQLATDPMVRRTYTVGGCQKTEMSHQHTLITQTQWDKCPNCSYQTNPNVIYREEICHF